MLNAAFFGLLVRLSGLSFAAPTGAIPPLNVNFGGAGTPEQTAVVLKIVAMLTLLSLAPSLLDERSQSMRSNRSWVPALRQRHSELIWVLF